MTYSAYAVILYTGIFKKCYCSVYIGILLISPSITIFDISTSMAMHILVLVLVNLIFQKLKLNSVPEKVH